MKNTTYAWTITEIAEGFTTIHDRGFRNKNDAIAHIVREAWNVWHNDPDDEPESEPKLRDFVICNPQYDNEIRIWHEEQSSEYLLKRIAID